MIHVFFRNVEVLRQENIPNDGPLLIVSNHNNQFIDPMMIVKAVRKRPVRFIIAEKSTHRPVIGQVSRGLGSVPVVRSQDRAKNGTGVIVSFDEEALILRGEGTRFTEECTERWAITIRGIGNLRIDEILSDTALRMADGKAWIEEFQRRQQNGASSFQYKVTPKIDQNETYEKVYEALFRNEIISIFPEGTSHDNTSLLNLKPGVAVMALGAQAKGATVRIMAIGINYFAGHQFRSNVVMECGIPFEIPESIITLWGSGDTEEENRLNRRAAYAELMTHVQDALEKVTFNAPNYRVLVILRTARRLYQGEIELSLEDYMKLYHRFANAWLHWREDEEFKRLERDIDNYLISAAAIGLNDKQIQHMPGSNTCCNSLKILGEILFSVLILTPLLILALPGIILLSPLLCRLDTIIRKEMAKALEGSLVKNKALDVAQSQRALLTVKYYPPLILIYAIITGILLGLLWDTEEYTGEWHEPISDNLFWIFPLVFLVIFPLYSYFAVKVIEALTIRYRILPGQMFLLREIANDKFKCCCYFCQKPKETVRKKSLSHTSNLRLRRKNLAVRTREIVGRLTMEDPIWANDPIISQHQLEREQEKESEAVVTFLKRNESLDQATIDHYVHGKMVDNLV